jgi:hypothetical protein
MAPLLPMAPEAIAFFSSRTGAEDQKKRLHKHLLKRTDGEHREKLPGSRRSGEQSLRESAATQPNYRKNDCELRSLTAGVKGRNWVKARSRDADYRSRYENQQA